MLRRVALVRTDLSEEHSATIIRVTGIGELGRTLAVASNRHTLRRNTMMEALRSSETSILRKSTRRNIPKEGILRSQGRENSKCYKNQLTYRYIVRESVE
jgi:hypothetical protein